MKRNGSFILLTDPRLFELFFSCSWEINVSMSFLIVFFKWYKKLEIEMYAYSKWMGVFKYQLSYENISYILRAKSNYIKSISFFVPNNSLSIFILMVRCASHPIIKYNLKLNVTWIITSTCERIHTSLSWHEFMLWYPFIEILFVVQIVITTSFWLNDVTFDCMLLQFDINSQPNLCEWK